MTAAKSVGGETGEEEVDGDRGRHRDGGEGDVRVVLLLRTSYTPKFLTSRFEGERKRQRELHNTTNTNDKLP